MKEQIYKIKNIDSFELKDIFECGQCFRWNEQEDVSYTGIFGKTVLNVKKIENEIIFKGISDKDIIQEIHSYFDFIYNISKQQHSKNKGNNRKTF